MKEGHSETPGLASPPPTSPMQLHQKGAEGRAGWEACKEGSGCSARPCHRIHPSCQFSTPFLPSPTPCSRGYAATLSGQGLPSLLSCSGCGVAAGLAIPAELRVVLLECPWIPHSPLRGLDAPTGPRPTEPYVRRAPTPDQDQARLAQLPLSRSGPPGASGSPRGHQRPASFGHPIASGILRGNSEATALPLAALLLLPGAALQEERS